MKENSVAEQRSELLGILDEFLMVARNKVEDSEQVTRRLVYASDGHICELAFGDEEATTRVEPNHFNATLVVFEGSVKIDFDNGTSTTITENERSLFIPKHTGFTVNSIHKSSAILTILDRL